MIEYINKHYDNVQVFFKDNWMRLDFQKYSQLTAEDVKKAISDLYDFMKNYDYFEKISEIKSKLYDEAL